MKIVSGVITVGVRGVTGKLSDNFKKKYASRNAFKRMAKVSDYAGSMIFLCSDASGYMTGANLIVDGGWTDHYEIIKFIKK